MDLTVRQIVEATGGSLCFAEEKQADDTEAFLDSCVDSVVLDSRQVTEGGVFIATVGERADGHSFVESVYEKKALLAIVERKPEKDENWKRYLLVEDTLQALKDIGECYRKGLSIPVIGITGSVGKTSTKEFIAGVLSEKYNVLKTQGNYNNEIGVPLTLLKIRAEHQVAVVEMGISDFGEMHRLSKMARPDIAVITNIGQCHLENLKDRDGVLRAKTEIFDYMSPEGTIFLNGDDDKLQTVTAADGRQVVFFGTKLTGPGNVYVTDRTNKGLRGSTVMLHAADGACFEADIPLPGEHMVLNGAAAAGVGALLGLTTEEIRKGLGKVEAVGGRNHLIYGEHFTVIDDCYNANPVSMKAGIDLLCMADTVTVAILGDMFELGENAAALHGEVGAYAAEKGVDRIICVGTLSKQMKEEAIARKPRGEVLYFATREELLAALPENKEAWLPEGSTVLVKASHGMKFSEVVEYLCKTE